MRLWAKRLPWLPILAIIVAVLLRLNPDLGRDLWEDEVLSAMHADQPFWRLPIEVVRDDIHPFLYFLQLRVWSLLGGSDLWLRLNSVALNCAAILLLFLACRALYGRRVGATAACLFALSAPAVWMSQEVRPYSWLYCLTVAAFFLIERAFGAVRRDRRFPLGAFLCCLGLVYSHAIGFTIVLLLGIYALGRILARGDTARAGGTWLTLFGLCALLALPQLAVDMLRDANIASDVNFFSNLIWVPRAVLPFGGNRVFLVLAALLYVGVAGLGGMLAETRLMAGVFLVLPMAVVVLLGPLHANIFKLNIFTTAVTPFLAIVAARVLAFLPARRQAVAAGALGALLIMFSLAYYGSRPPTTGFRAASAFIRAGAAAGDLVYVPQPSLFWGMARYLGTNEHGWALAAAPALNDRWQRLYDRLGPGIVSALNLAPQRQTLPSGGGLTLLVGAASLPAAEKAPRVWLVIYPRIDLPATFPPEHIGRLGVVRRQGFGLLTVLLYR
jgi:hypothetical protein